MDIVLDTNIFRSDFTLRSKDFEVVIDYLAKTNSSIILPQIILDEISGIYKRELHERIQTNKNSSDNINLIITDSKKHIQIKNYNIQEELNEYITYIKNRFKVVEKNILPYKNEFLPEISKRSIERHKPVKKDGHGFRDVLIWLTIIDYCEKTPEKQIAFLGNNSNDFSNQEKTDLHPKLKKECESLGIKINYYKTIKEFIETHSSKIDFITTEWLLENIKDEIAEENLKEVLSHRDSNQITSEIKHNTGLDPTGKYSINYAELYELGEFFIYEKLNHEIIVNIDAKFYVGLDFDYYDAPYEIQVDENRYEQQYWNGNHSIDFRVNSYITLKIVGGEIQEYDIEDVSLN